MKFFQTIKFRQNGEMFMFLMVLLIFKRARTIQACQLPHGLDFHAVHKINDIHRNQFMSYLDENGLLLDVPDSQYRFDLRGWIAANKSNSCNESHFDNYVHIRFPKDSILNKRFNLQGLMTFLLHYEKFFRIYLANLQAIELDLGITQNSSNTKLTPNHYNYRMNLYNTRFDFRINGHPVKTCKQMMDANLTKPRSIFQITPNHEFVEMLWLNPRFIRPLCPLMFWHARLHPLVITGMVYSFYKSNFLSFTNETKNYHIYSSISVVQFFKCENIQVDEKLLNPLIFSSLKGNQSFLV